MKNNIRVLLQDDTEILGNGLGHVMSRIYLPLKKYIKLLANNNAKSTFFVDMGHLLFLKKYQDFQDFKIQAILFEESIIMILQNGMDVQLHIHPQWHQASIKDNYAVLTDEWNIGELSESNQFDLISRCINELNHIIKKSGIKQEITAFKGGAWGLQPFSSLGRILFENGIKLIFGPKIGLKLDGLNVDFTKMEENASPYYCEMSDLCRLSNKKNLIVVPISPTYLNWMDLIKYSKYLLLKRMEKYFDKPIDLDEDFPYHILHEPNASETIKINYSLKPLKTHLKMNSQSFWYLRNTFKRTLKYIEKSNPQYPLITIETHTKDFKNRYNDIQKFIQFISTEYANVEFITVTELLNDITSSTCIPKMK